MKRSLCLFIMFLHSICFANGSWQQFWEKGHSYLSNSQYQEAALEFDQAITLMSEEEMEKFPYVLVDSSENDYFQQNYARVIENTEKALISKNLTDDERLTCGMRRLAAFLQLGEEDSAVETYKKYIIGCPLFPKYDYFKEKIVIRNIPNCDYYKSCTKDRILSRFCQHEEDIHDYGNTWIINVTKDCNSYPDHQNTTESNLLLEQNLRTPEQIQACCNTCNKLATAANFICSCLPIPPQLGGPITAATCRFACIILVEDLRQDCENCCHNTEGKCWNTFESWKSQFKKENPRCGRPPIKCSE